MHDLTPATTTLTQLVAGTRDDQLASPTPDGDATVADLLDHIDGFCRAFTAAAVKNLAAGDQRSLPDGSRLSADWRTRIPEHLAGLAFAWQAESAWDGMTRAGGQDMPGAVAAAVATNEVLVHGWDLAAATGQHYAADPGLVEAARAFVAPTAEQNPQGTPGLFGPPVTVPEDAPPLDRLIALTGRDPGWQSGPGRTG